MPDDAVNAHGRRWLAFSLRSLLLVVTGVAGFYGGRATMHRRLETAQLTAEQALDRAAEDRAWKNIALKNTSISSTIIGLGVGDQRDVYWGQSFVADGSIATDLFLIGKANSKLGFRVLIVDSSTPTPEVLYEGPFEVLSNRSSDLIRVDLGRTRLKAGMQYVFVLEASDADTETGPLSLAGFHQYDPGDFYSMRGPKGHIGDDLYRLLTGHIYRDRDLAFDIAYEDQ